MANRKVIIFSNILSFDDGLDFFTNDYKNNINKIINAIKEKLIEQFKIPPNTVIDIYNQQNINKHVKAKEVYTVG